MYKKKLDWADMDSDNSEDEFLNKIVNVNIDEIPKTKKIISKGNDINSLFLEEEKSRKKKKIIEETNINLNENKESNNDWKFVTKKKRSKCYTCFPRRKVMEHIIEKNEHVSFHHDLCNRNIIVVTPNKHFNNFTNVDPKIISDLFLCTHKFCLDWNIKDYSVTYSQGDWQTHEHFHLKIKTYENTIKRLRGDHWRRQKILKERNAVQD